MAEKNPAKNIVKLRLEAGEEEIIPESSFDQFEPATSYKLGTSTLAVDMTSADWPLTGDGAVNTSRSNDDFATQSFQPLGSDLIYNRRWDGTPIDYSDPFEGTLGSSYDTNKWQLDDEFDATINLQDQAGRRSLHIDVGKSFSGIVGRWYFPSGGNDFDIQVYLNRGAGIGGPSIMIGPKDKLMDTAGGYGYFNDNILGVEGNSETYRCYTYGDVDGFSTFGSMDPQYFRLVKSGSTVYIYRKALIDDDWILVRSSSDMGAAFNATDLYVKLYSGQTSEPCYWDDFLINSYTILVEENPSDAHWSDWQEIKNAEDTLAESQSVADQAASDAVSEHETLKHVQGINPTDSPEFVDVSISGEFYKDGNVLGGVTSIHTTTSSNEGITASVNGKYIVDTTNSTANIILTMPTAEIGDTVTICDMKGNFASAGSKNVVTNTITFEGSSTTFEFDETDKLKTLMFIDLTYGWKSI